MASICKNLIQSCSSLRNCQRFQPNYIFRRYINADPEEDIARLYIHKSLKDRLAELSSEPDEPKAIGKSFTKPLVVQSLGKKITDGEAQLHPNQDSDVSHGEFENLQLCAFPQQEHLIRVANHYNIFRDLFSENIVFDSDPCVNLEIAFQINNQEVIRVLSGNRLQPVDTQQAPCVHFTGNVGKLYSLLLVNLDGHLTRADGEYLHWFSSKNCCYVSLSSLFTTIFNIKETVWF